MSNDKKLIKIRNLLKQAEDAEKNGSTSEAIAFSEAAQRLSFEYSIDLDVARAAMTKQERSIMLVVETFETNGKPGERGLRNKALYYSSIARAYGNRCDLRHNGTAIIVYGTQEQVDLAKIVLLSLEAQFQTELVRAKKSHDNSNGERFSKVDFTDGYWSKVNSRIQREQREVKDEAIRHAEEVEKEVTESINENAESNGVALAIITRETEVNDFYSKRSNARGSFKVGSYGSYGSSRDAGSSAGSKAVIGDKKGIGRSRALTS